MGKIWEFFDTLSEYVYVADMDTHDLVYMNQMALKAFGVSSPEEVRKHKCHALLQNCSALLVSTPDQKKIDFLYPQISLPIIPAIAVY